MVVLGLNDKDMKRFSDFLVKANAEQLDFMVNEIAREMSKRMGLAK